MQFKSFITGVAGLTLSVEEKAIFADQRPCGLILFTRNCDTPDQVRRLTDDFKNALQTDQLLVLVDQEGGRIQRMRPPHWRNWPAGRHYGALYEKNAEAGIKASRMVSGLIARELLAVGINVNCVPVLDLPVTGAHDIIGDRAYGDNIETVVAVGRAIAEGFMSQGVLPVIKHMPGHGRATADSHQSLPIIETPLEELRTNDFIPFKELADLPMAMTAHVVMTAIDRENPVSVSPTAIHEIIREEIGYDGLVMSDDLHMNALSGTMGERAKNTVEAGCDVALYCKGNTDEIIDTAESVPPLGHKAAERFERAIALLANQDPFDAREAEQHLEELLQK